MEFWVDIENSAGAKYGSGPVHVESWEHKLTLDGSGTIKFRVPAGDPNAGQVQNKRIAHCYGILDGAVTDLGMGIIDDIKVSVGPPTTLEVSGPDILAELATRSVHGLIIREQAWSNLTSATFGRVAKIQIDRSGGASNYSWEIVNAMDGNDATAGAMNMRRDVDPSGFPEANIWLYVGVDARWDAVDFTLLSGGRVNERDSMCRVQYYNGSAWTDEAIVSDGTIGGGGKSFEQSGIMTFTRPADWARYKAEANAGDWFWRRFGVTAASGNEAIGDAAEGYIDLAEVKVLADVPTTNGINLIMAYAPDTWVKTGYPDTVSEKYLEFHGESVLEALVTLAEQGGTDGTDAVREHFRYDPTTPRTLDWLGDTVTASGVRAAAPVSVSTPVDELVVIRTLTQQKISQEVVTRVYPRTLDGITLALATVDAPTGYTHSTASNYIQHTAGYSAYGLIEQWVEFSELNLQQADSYTTHPTDLANQLHERAVEYLRTHGMLNYLYSLSVVAFPALLLPGDTIECVYHEYRDGVHTVNIDTITSSTPLHMLSTTLQVTVDGVATIGLEVATIDRAPKSDAGVVVDLVRQNRRAGTGAGNLATIAVTGGGTPPIAGPDIRVDGYEVSRAGNGVLLFSGNGALLAEYAADATGLAAALAAAASGDIVEIPAGTITANVTIPAGVTLRGRGWASIINGYVIVGVGAMLDNCKVYQSVNSSDDIIGVMGPDAAGTGYVRDVLVELIQAGSGKALGTLARGGAGAYLEWKGNYRIRVSGGTGSRWAYASADDGAVIMNHGNVKAWIGA